MNICNDLCKLFTYCWMGRMNAARYLRKNELNVFFHKIISWFVFRQIVQLLIWYHIFSIKDLFLFCLQCILPCYVFMTVKAQFKLVKVVPNVCTKVISSGTFKLMNVIWSPQDFILCHLTYWSRNALLYLYDFAIIHGTY